MREIFSRTEIVRKPTYGIVSGYHELPYVCLGECEEEGWMTTRVQGRVQVSPRFVLRPEHLGPRYRDLFGEDVDDELAGRLFGFLGFRGKPVECTSDGLEVRHLEVPVEEALEQTLAERERMEDITLGVILTPDTRYFPISVERFISSVIDDEFAL
jgi:hypothetical protein